MPLKREFYLEQDVVAVARNLLGKYLLTNVNNTLTGGRIVETEAYSFREQGCHAYGNKVTSRNRVMFEKGSYAYVYLCYGLHNMFNVVTNHEGYAEAVLIRAIEPLEGIEEMKKRRGNSILMKNLANGPGKLAHALAIERIHNGIDLLGDVVWIEEDNKPASFQIAVSTRIGIDYAGDDALLPWRFTVRDSPWISKPPH